jgi:hypothetical protein
VFGALVRGSYPQQIRLEILPNRKRATLELVIRRMIQVSTRLVASPTRVTFQ